MNGITLWYAKLSRKARIALLCGVIGLILIVVAVVAYMTMVPEKVQVRFGTIVRDPIDGHVWEDNTQTIMVNPSEAANYQLVYIDRLSDEHAKQIEAQKKQMAEDRKKIEAATGMQAMETVVPVQQMRDLETMQNNIDVMGQEVISGLQIANEIDQTRNTLRQFRNQVASAPIPAELEPLRQEGLEIVDLAIQACNLTLQAIGTGDQATLRQAINVAQQAAQAWQNLISKFTLPQG